MAFQKFSAVTLLTLLIGCFPSVSPPLGTPNAVLEADEIRLIADASEIAQELAKSSLAISDKDTKNLLTRIGQKVTPPELKRTEIQVRVHPFWSALPNAFSLPSGDVFISSALICNAETEGQLAVVIAHEISHVYRRHSIEKKRNSGHRSLLWQSIGFPVNALSLGIASAIGEMSSASGFSKRLENQADDDAFQALLAAGYDTHNSVRIFQQLQNFTADEEIGESIFFSSHPALQARIEHFKELSEGHPLPAKPSRQVSSSLSGAFVQAVCLKSLQTSIELGFFKSAERLLNSLLQQFPANADLLTLKGDLLRMRQGKEWIKPSDYVEAVETYQKALTLSSIHRQALLGLSRTLLLLHRTEEARTYIRRFISLYPSAIEKNFFREFL